MNELIMTFIDEESVNSIKFEKDYVYVIQWDDELECWAYSKKAKV